MATTRAPSNGKVDAAAGSVAVKAKDAGGAVASVARRASTPAVAAGAAAAGLASGLLIGARIAPRRRRTVALGAVAGGLKHVATAAGKAQNTADDIHALREHLDKVNRRSPIEVVLEGLTHRRGAPRRREH